MCTSEKNHLSTSTGLNWVAVRAPSPSPSLRNSTWLRARSREGVGEYIHQKVVSSVPPHHVYQRAEDSRLGHIVSQQSGVGDIRKWS